MVTFVGIKFILTNLWNEFCKCFNFLTVVSVGKFVSGSDYVQLSISIADDFYPFSWKLRGFWISRH